MRVEREIAAPPATVFDAWTDPQTLQLWLAPDPMTVSSAECEVRVWGAYRIVMVGERAAIEHTGE